MIEIIDDVFATRNDPGQLQVTPEDRQRLQELHPATLTEYNEGNGPCVWVLLIPTTSAIMNDFIKGRIGETELLWKTTPGEKLDCVYLCSATTLPEYRNKGITSRLTLDAIAAIQRDHPVTTLFVWPFTEEGKSLAEKIAKKAGLPLVIKPH